MNMIKIAFPLLALLLLPLFTQPGWAKVYQSVDKTHDLEQAPIDMASSADGKYTYILAEKGTLYVFSGDGARNEIHVDPSMDHISTAALGEKIFLSSTSTKKVQEIFVDFEQTINIDGSPFLGDENGSVIIAVFSDFQCPHCAKLGAVFEEILAKYPTGVKIVYKHFPLNFHQFAANAALASVAAQEQGKFWQYHDLLFENYQTLSNEKFTEFAQKLGLNMPLFNKSMSSQESRGKVIKDLSEGRAMGITGTPTVFVNGRKVRDKSVQGLQKFISEDLQKQQ